MAYVDFKDFPRRTASDKKLLDKAFDIAKSSKYDGYQRCLTSMIYKFLDKASFATRASKSACDIIYISYSR